MIYFTDCMDWFKENIKPIRMIFADPPDNIGLKYHQESDKRPHAEYIEDLNLWLHTFCLHADIVWLSFNAKYIAELGITVRALKALNYGFKPCVQTYTFYQHNTRDLGNAYRPLWRFNKPGVKFYPDQIRVESWRQQNGDKRGNPKGKVPGDVFEFTRVTGNSSQRREWHPTQLNEGLVRRCVKFSTQEGDLVVDPFAGTGTTLRVCKKLNRDCILLDNNLFYCDKIAKEHGLRVL